MLISNNGNTSFDCNTGELEMKGVKVNEKFPYVWEGKEKERTKSLLFLF